MMLSFVPKLDLSRFVDTPRSPFHRFIHRCFVQLDPATTSVGDIIHTASSKLGAHLLLRSAYKGEPAAPFKILSVWAVNDDGPIGVAVPLTSDDFLLSDAVIARTGEAGFGAAPPIEDGPRFMVPADICIHMLMNMSLSERQRTFVASPHMQSVWKHRIFFDLPSSEFYFEVDFEWKE